MNKTIITVPKGIRYLSEWKDYDLGNFTQPVILNKSVTGCGLTSDALENKYNVVLISPRLALLENKFSQYSNSVFYFRNNLEKTVEYDMDLHKDENRSNNEAYIMTPETLKREKEAELAEQKLKAISAERVKFLKEEVINYCLITKAQNPNKPVKILVTYDSFRYVKEAIISLIGFDAFREEFICLVDEAQSVFVDAKFKSTTELELLYYLQDLSRVIFASATPMIESYLDQMDEFKDLPYIEFDWKTEDPKRVTHPFFAVHPLPNIQDAVSNIINSYKTGQFEEFPVKDESGYITMIPSTEAVIFMNSVSAICKAIKRNGLKFEECNVLCARSSANKAALMKAFGLGKKTLKEKYGKDTPIGTIPGKGESHKMFTFCTRTVYLGADFYSTCARTFIFSDANIDSLSVDITLDLPQIMGRQRLDENPWRNRADLFVQFVRSEKNREDYQAKIKEKIKDSNILLDIHENQLSTDEQRQALVTTYQRNTDAYNYKYNYIGVNHHAGKAPIPVFNKLVYLAEKRTYEIQQLDYRNQVSMFSKMDEEEYGYVNADDLMLEFDGIKQFQDKLRYLCELRGTIDEKKFLTFLEEVPQIYRTFYTILGPEICKAECYYRFRLKSRLDQFLNNQYISAEQLIKFNFEIGEKYSRKEVKEKLQELYDKAGLMKRAKASDILEYYEVKECMIINSKTGKKDHGYELMFLRE